MAQNEITVIKAEDLEKVTSLPKSTGAYFYSNSFLLFTMLVLRSFWRTTAQNMKAIICLKSQQELISIQIQCFYAVSDQLLRRTTLAIIFFNCVEQLYQHSFFKRSQEVISNSNSLFLFIKVFLRSLGPKTAQNDNTALTFL